MSKNVGKRGCGRVACSFLPAAHNRHSQCLVGAAGHTSDQPYGGVSLPLQIYQWLADHSMSLYSLAWHDSWPYIFTYPNHPNAPERPAFRATARDRTSDRGYMSDHRGMQYLVGICFNATLGVVEGAIRHLFLFHVCPPKGDSGYIM